MAKKSNTILKKETITRKEYNYQLQGTSLIFTLRTDNTTELFPYRELLKLGLADVEKDINLIQKSRVSKTRK